MNEQERVQFIKRLEKMGVQKVRESLGYSICDGEEVRIAKAWIAEKESELKREANAIARSAKNSSWWAIVIASISLIVSVLVAIFKK